MSHRVLNPEQFFHGTHAELSPGEMIEPGHRVNFAMTPEAYPNPGKDVFFTTSAWHAQGYANRAAAQRGGYGHTYRVEPTGPYEEHYGGAYRSRAPLRIKEKVEVDR